jgi:hypothetical protein
VLKADLRDVKLIVTAFHIRGIDESAESGRIRWDITVAWKTLGFDRREIQRQHFGRIVEIKITLAIH